MNLGAPGPRGFAGGPRGFAGERHGDLTPYNENCSDLGCLEAWRHGGSILGAWRPGGMEAWRHTWADNDDESDGVDAKMDDEDGCWEDVPHARRSERSADFRNLVITVASDTVE